MYRLFLLGIVCLGVFDKGIMSLVGTRNTTPMDLRTQQRLNRLQNTGIRKADIAPNKGDPQYDMTRSKDILKAVASKSQQKENEIYDRAMIANESLSKSKSASLATPEKGDDNIVSPQTSTVSMGQQMTMASSPGLINNSTETGIKVADTDDETIAELAGLANSELEEDSNRKAYRTGKSKGPSRWATVPPHIPGHILIGSNGEDVVIYLPKWRNISSDGGNQADRGTTSSAANVSSLTVPGYIVDELSSTTKTIATEASLVASSSSSSSLSPVPTTNSATVAPASLGLVEMITTKVAPILDNGSGSGFSGLQLGDSPLPEEQKMENSIMGSFSNTGSSAVSTYATVAEATTTKSTAVAQTTVATSQAAIFAQVHPSQQQPLASSISNDRTTPGNNQGESRSLAMNNNNQDAATLFSSVQYIPDTKTTPTTIPTTQAINNNNHNKRPDVSSFANAVGAIGMSSSVNISAWSAVGNKVVQMPLEVVTMAPGVISAPGGPCSRDKNCRDTNSKCVMVPVILPGVVSLQSCQCVGQTTRVYKPTEGRFVCVDIKKTATA